MTQYLTGRTQSVSFNGYSSEFLKVSSGIPQGSHLGPLIFVLFINDLPTVLKFSKILLFADDAKIFRYTNSSDDCEKLQTDFNNLLIWCKQSDLSINVGKCNILTFCRKRSMVKCDYMLENTKISQVSEFCDLGVTFDTKLCFKKHVSIIKAKAFFSTWYD